MDKLAALSIFIAVNEHGGFSRAAEQLGKTPSAITKVIGHLEQELGTPLFERTTRRMTLTEAGQLYLGSTRDALARLKLADEEVQQLQFGLTGTLRIAAPPSFGPAFLNAVCNEFLDAHPSVRLEVSLTDTLQELLDGGCDIALRHGPADLPEVIAVPILENRLIVCAAPAYLARKGADLSLESFHSHDWLIFRHPLVNKHFWWLTSGGETIRVRQPKPRLESDNFDFLLGGLLAGQGVQFIPQWTAWRHLRSGDLVHVSPAIERVQSSFGPTIHLQFFPHLRNTRKVRVFIEFLKAYIDRNALQ